ncbi:MAG: hypothetical protein K0S08_663 [Gammaproteobacteria bacterium]|jgi:hypothetical protein|nr:hypothetical protein [Gammaproteobacteria bacterium]
MLLDKTMFNFFEQKEQNFWNNLLLLDLWFWQGKLKRNLEKLKADSEKEFLIFKRHLMLDDQISAEIISQQLERRKEYAIALLEPVFYFPTYQSVEQRNYIDTKKHNYKYILEAEQLDQRKLKTAARVRVEVLQAHLEPVYQQRIVPDKKRSGIFFDEKRAYRLLHNKTVADVIGISNKLQLSSSASFSLEAFDRCRKTSKPVERFQSFVAHSFSSCHEAWEALMQELSRVEEAMPGKVASLFFGKTKEVCMFWQGELYVKQVEALDVAIKRFQTLVEAFYYWVSKLPVTETLSAQEFQGFLKVIEMEASQLQRWTIYINHLDTTFSQGQTKGSTTQNRLRFHALLTPINDRINQVGEKLVRIKANQQGLSRSRVLTSSVPAGSEGLSQKSTLTTKAILNQLAEGIPLSQGNLDKLLLELNTLHSDTVAWKQYLEDHKATLDSFKERVKGLLINKNALSEIPYLEQGVLFFAMLGQDQSLYGIKKNIQMLRAEFMTDEGLASNETLATVDRWLAKIGTTNCERLDQLSKRKTQLESQIDAASQALTSQLQHISTTHPTIENLFPNVQQILNYFQLYYVQELSELPKEQLLNKELLVEFLKAAGIPASTIFQPLFALSHLFTEIRKLSHCQRIIHDEMVKNPLRKLTEEDIQRTYDELYREEQQAPQASITMRL